VCVSVCMCVYVCQCVGMSVYVCQCVGMSVYVYVSVCLYVCERQRDLHNRLYALFSTNVVSIVNSNYIVSLTLLGFCQLSNIIGTT
jgi:hypothetical protein